MHPVINEQECLQDEKLDRRNNFKRYFGLATDKEQALLKTPEGLPRVKNAELNKYAADIKYQLDKVLLKEDSGEWLRLLYSRYSERFIKDNEKIWTTAAIFIPLSLAGLIYVNNASFGRAILLAFGSIKLMEFWVNVAENHRAFQNKSQAIIKAIENHTIGVDFNSVTGKNTKGAIEDIPYGEKLDCHPFIKVVVQSKRWHMLYFVRRIWWAAVVFSFFKAAFGIYLVQDLAKALNNNADPKDDMPFPAVLSKIVELIF